MSWGSQQPALAIASSCQHNPAVVPRAQAVAWALALHWGEIHLYQDAWGCLSVGICGPGDRGIPGVCRAPHKVGSSPESWIGLYSGGYLGPTRPCSAKGYRYMNVLGSCGPKLNHCPGKTRSQGSNTVKPHVLRILLKSTLS